MTTDKRSKSKRDTTEGTGIGLAIGVGVGVALGAAFGLLFGFTIPSARKGNSTSS